jgi:hypothetical protein
MVHHKHHKFLKIKLKKKIQGNFVPSDGAPTSTIKLIKLNRKKKKSRELWPK